MNQINSKERMDSGFLPRSPTGFFKGRRGCALWLTGVSGAGKSTIASIVKEKLDRLELPTYILDGDSLRQGLNHDLSFTDSDRMESVRRTAEVMKLFVDAGFVVIVSMISPFRQGRSFARSLLNEGEFWEVHVDTPLHIAEQRDPKGLYARARQGRMSHFTGIGSEYQCPERPELRIPTVHVSAEVAAERIVSRCIAKGLLNVECEKDR